MPISAPPEIPQITDPSTFATRAQAWVVWQANELYPAITDASNILTQSTSSTSSTSNTIGTGAKTFTVETGKGYLAGQSLSIAYTTTPTNRMFAVVTSYDSVTGALVVDVQAIEGSGTFTAWSIALAFNGKVATSQLSFDSGALGNRNILINAGFRINQRGYVSAAVLAAGAYAHDRWKAGAAGGDYSFTQLSTNTQITIASGKSLIQVVEDKNVNETAYVLSWEGTAQARVGVNSATPSGAYASSPILITGQTAGTTMSVEFNTGTLGKAQLEAGSIATPFEFRPYGTELALCQRYYQVTGAQWIVETTSVEASKYHAVPMRVIPTASGGGAGYTYAGNGIHLTEHQTTRNFQSMSYSAEL